MKDIPRALLDLFIIAFLVILLLHLIGISEKQNQLKEYWEHRSFKTDTATVFVNYSKIPKELFSKPVPPAIVIQYIDSTKQINKFVSVSMDDSLITVIDSLQNTITKITSLYLKLYPASSKLIYGEFSKDSLRLDLLSIDGIIRQHNYHVNYSRFEYQYNNGEFRARPINVSSTKFHSNLFTYGGYDFSLASPILGMDYSLSKGRFRFEANTFLGVSFKPTLNLQGSIGYQLR